MNRGRWWRLWKRKGTARRGPGRGGGEGEGRSEDDSEFVA